MSDIAIRVEGLGKRYRIGQGSRSGYKSLRESLANGLQGTLDRLPAILGGNGGKSNGESSHDHIWALKDVSFEVKRGEVVGVIGRNGAGKSTLLKIISRITAPTEGSVDIFGRVGSLLEVGTGFHPELTGRENIYLNGAILGMRQAEIEAKFDEIVAFSELEKFIDTPVKFYSSGMYVRLAFAVAAHLEPEILLVDEVLAVGDAAFQKKCLGKMGEVAGEGRTVLFVSHNMSAVTRLCKQALRLEEGELADRGHSPDVVERYIGKDSPIKAMAILEPDAAKPMRLRKVVILNSSGVSSTQLEMGEPFRVCVEYDINRPVTAAHVICFIHTNEGVNVFGTGDADTNPRMLQCRSPGKYAGCFEVPAFLLGEGEYYITVSLGVPFQVAYDRHEAVAVFSIVDNSSMRREWLHRRRPGVLGIEIDWTYSNMGRD